MCNAGQQQLLAVARVLLQAPGLVLLDECSAAVDAHVARQVQDLLHKHLAGSTVIQVPHRAAFHRVKIAHQGHACCVIGLSGRVLHSRRWPKL